MGCAGVGGGVDIAICTLDLPTYDGAVITDQGTAPAGYVGQSFALYPSGNALLKNMFLDLGGGSCTFPFRDFGFAALSGTLLIPIATRVTNLGTTSPIFMVKLTIFACSDALNATMALQIGLGFLGVQIDGVTPSSYTTGGPVGLTQYEAWFRLNPATGLAWVYDDLFGFTPVDFNINISLGNFDVVAGWIDVFFGADAANLILQEDPDDPADESNTDGGVEVNGSPVLVLSVDSSGLYVLTHGKTDDTLYTRNVADSTVDVAIPEPFGTTGPMGD